MDLSDPLGANLVQLEQLCKEGNGFAAWLAYRLCRIDGRALPEWVLTYLDAAAAFLLDEYHRGDTQGRMLERGLKLNAIKSQRDEALGEGRWRPTWRSTVEAMLPDLIDKHAEQRRLPIQTAIRELAPALGYPGEQWMRLRDVYSRSKVRRAR